MFCTECVFEIKSKPWLWKTVCRLHKKIQIFFNLLNEWYVLRGKQKTQRKLVWNKIFAFHFPTDAESKFPEKLKLLFVKYWAVSLTWPDIFPVAFWSCSLWRECRNSDAISKTWAQLVQCVIHYIIVGWYAHINHSIMQSGCYAIFAQCFVEDSVPQNDTVSISLRQRMPIDLHAAIGWQVVFLDPRTYARNYRHKKKTTKDNKLTDDIMGRAISLTT